MPVAVAAGVPAEVGVAPGVDVEVGVAPGVDVEVGVASGVDVEVGEAVAVVDAVGVIFAAMLLLFARTKTANGPDGSVVALLMVVDRLILPDESDVNGAFKV